MKVLLIFPPLRGKAERGLPEGCLAIACALQEMNIDVQILNLDLERLDDAALVQRVKDYDPDVVGFSAVTSTTYLFIKRTSKLIAENISRKITLIVGGNITASSGLLINNCRIDVCFIGEGYFSIKEFVLAYDKMSKTMDYEKLSQVKGLVFKYKGEIVFTGKRSQSSLNDIPFPKNLDLIDTKFYFPLVKDEIISHMPASAIERIARLPIGSKHARVMLGRGCQNACSFCHRNVSGLRQRSIPIVFEYIDYLINRYNIRRFTIDDESLFAREDWIRSFTSEISKRNVVFTVSGIRADMVVKYADILRYLVNAGLIELNVGHESGAQYMLDIMDKHVNEKDNFEAIRVINSLGVHSGPQIIFGMPGDSVRNIKNTAKMVRTCRSSNGSASINLAQVLPGTPLYWFAIKKGFIKDEEEYLIRISHQDASQLKGTVNVTEYPLPLFELARDKIAMRARWTNGKWNLCAWHFLHYWWVLAKRTLRKNGLSIREKMVLLVYALTGMAFKTRNYGFEVGSLRKMMLKEDGAVIRMDPIKCLKYGI